MRQKWRYLYAKLLLYLLLRHVNMSFLKRSYDEDNTKSLANINISTHGLRNTVH